MLLIGTKLVERLTGELASARQKIKGTPGLALIWVGDDKPTASFVRAKQRMAQTLSCDFFLHHFTAASNDQLTALIKSLNNKKSANGIILQLPLPKPLHQNELIELISPEKDIDALRAGSPYPSPTPAGVVALLEEYKINPAEEKTIILGDGQLVGHPLTKLFGDRGWPFEQIARQAESKTKPIREATLLISATGIPHLVGEGMVNKEMIVIDGSGVDTDPKKLEPLVKMITPARGAIGPLTVAFLFQNLLAASAKAFLDIRISD